MEIKTHITESDFVKVNLYLYYRKLTTKILIGLAFVMLILELVFPDENENFLYRFGFPLAILFLFPLLVYLGAKKSYRSNLRIKEEIKYEFQDQDFVVTGESFNAKMSWDKIIKVTQTPKWILIWQSKRSVNFISKSNIFPSDIDRLRQVLAQNKVKSSL